MAAASAVMAMPRATAAPRAGASSFASETETSPAAAAIGF